MNGPENMTAAAQDPNALGDQIRLSLPYPISANRYWRLILIKDRPMVKVSEEAKAFKSLAGWLAKKNGVRRPIRGPVKLTVVFHAKQTKDAKKPEPGTALDLDNVLKVTIDALKGVAYEDDDQIAEIHAVRGAAIPNGGVDVWIEPQPATSGLFA